MSSINCPKCGAECKVPSRCLGCGRGLPQPADLFGPKGTKK